MGKRTVLTDEETNILMKLFLEDKSDAEIAKEMNLTLKQIKTVIKRLKLTSIHKRPSRLIDLTGQWFGFLEVVKRVHKPEHLKSDGTYYKCICHCGYCDNKEIVVTSGRLKSGQSTSCGCSEVRAERMSKTMKKYNDYDLESKEYGIGYTSNNIKFYFDKEDYDKIKNYCWYIAADDSVCAHNSDKSQKVIFFHRLIMGVTNNKIQVDHNNHDRHDNRKGNLTVVTNSQNGMNKGISIRNTSGCQGVTFANDRSKWRAYITVDKKTINLGSFEKYEDAVKARKDAEKKYFGEYSYDNCVNRLPRIED